MGSNMATGKARRGAYRKYGSIGISPDGRVRFSPWTFPGLPQLDFTVVYGNEKDIAAGNYSISAHWLGHKDIIFMLFITRHRVSTACFAYDLSPDGLRHAISVIQNAGNGLERWIIPGLEWCQREFSLSKNPKPNYLAMLEIIPELLKSVRHLPVAASWKKLRVQIARWDREHAAAQAKGDRPADSGRPAGKRRSRSTPR